jgi:hypothetical protein
VKSGVAFATPLFLRLFSYDFILKKVITLKKAITIGLILIFIILSGCNSNQLKDADFTNLTPAEIVRTFLKNGG